MPAFEDAQADHRPDWVKQICQRRDHFTTCGIQGLVHGQLTSFAILYAVQRPYHIGLCRLERQGRAIPLFGEMPMAKQARFMHDLFDFDFILQVDQLLTDRDVHFDEGEDLQVLMHLEYRPACQVCSHFDTVPLSSFCSQHRATKEPKQSHGEKHGSSSRKLDYELLATFPWLERYMAISELSRPSSSSKTSRASSVPAPELDPDELELAWDQLDLRRREWADEDKYVGTDFETVIRGGAWTHAAKGMAYDCIMARSSSEVGSEFVKKYGLQKTVSFSYAKYGEQASNLLALHWTHKMQYLFNIYRDSDQHGYVFSDTDVDGHVPERTFAEFIEGVPLESPILQRVHQIKAIRPKRPVIAPGVAASSGD